MSKPKTVEQDHSAKTSADPAYASSRYRYGDASRKAVWQMSPEIFDLVHEGPYETLQSHAILRTQRTDAFESKLGTWDYELV